LKIKENLYDLSFINLHGLGSCVSFLWSWF